MKFKLLLQLFWFFLLVLLIITLNIFLEIVLALKVVAM